MDPCILTVERLTKCFGNLMAVCGLSSELGREETLGVIGPNGAGKTILFNLIVTSIGFSGLEDLGG